MGRIRSIKPEFWTDDLVGSLTRDERLLFIASWNLADDEGLLRWSAPFLKGAVFPYDDDMTVQAVEEGMKALEDAGVMFAYRAGRNQQSLAYIVNFHKHQKVNRPSPSKLPPPPIQDTRIRYMYGARDGFRCHLCDCQIDEQPGLDNEDFVLSIDHIEPVSSGGSDYPSNLRASHQTCNKGRGNRTVEQYRTLLREGKTHAQKRNPERFNERSVNGSVNSSLLDKVEGRVQDRDREEDQDKDRDQEEPRVNALSSAKQFFEHFWDIWPNKVGKPPAERAFAKVFAKHGFDPIMDGLARYVRDKPPDRPWLNPATFLNQERFFDAPAPAPEARAGPLTQADVLNELKRKVNGNVESDQHGIKDVTPRSSESGGCDSVANLFEPNGRKMAGRPMHDLHASSSNARGPVTLDAKAWRAG